jgi:hypothetical protein
MFAVSWKSDFMYSEKKRDKNNDYSHILGHSAVNRT